MINRLLIVGVGLIGGSLARALKAANYAHEIIGCGGKEEHLQLAVDLGVIDRYIVDMELAARTADLIVVCTPVGAMEQVFSSLAKGLADTTIITDVGSTKASVVAAAKRVFGEVPANFVPGHPIAGTEKSGVQASKGDLFVGRRVILTPLPQTSAKALMLVREMWEKTGAIIDEVGVEHHDDVLAATSHLPHVLAYLLVDTLANMEDKPEIFQFAAGGFKDFTRIASSDPNMWHDICVENSGPILAVIEQFMANLEKLKSAITTGDSHYIKQTFVRAKKARDAYCNK